MVLSQDMMVLSLEMMVFPLEMLIFPTLYMDASVPHTAEKTRALKMCCLKLKRIQFCGKMAQNKINLKLNVMNLT